jgi:hypothetical protein
MIALEEARQKATAWCNAWNNRDLDAIMTHYAEDVAFSSPTVVARWGLADGWLHGKAKLRDNFAIGVKAPGFALRTDRRSSWRECHVRRLSSRNRHARQRSR